MYVAKKYFTKYIYVCLVRKIPWICMYIAKISHETYICMFRQQDTLDTHVYSKMSHKNIHMFRQQIPHGKQTRKRNKQMIKKNNRKQKSKIYSSNLQKNEEREREREGGSDLFPWRKESG